VQYREATAEDVEAIAQLHADSWRRNYRGAFRDAFLDGPVVGERRTVWAERLTGPAPSRYTVVAEQDAVVVGFAHTIFDDDRIWGALVDNLHVVHDLKRHGVGRHLMAASAQAVSQSASLRNSARNRAVARCSWRRANRFPTRVAPTFIRVSLLTGGPTPVESDVDVERRRRRRGVAGASPFLTAYRTG